MTKDKNGKPYINHGNPGGYPVPGNAAGQADGGSGKGHPVGPEMVDDAPSILGEQKQSADGFTGTNAGGSAGYGTSNTYGTPNAANYPGNQNYQQNKKSYKGLLIFGIVVVSLIFLGFVINSFFSNLFAPITGTQSSGPDIPSSPYIARIAVEGELVSGGDSGYFSSGYAYDHEFTLKSIDDLIDDSNNKAILLYVDSPGGGVYESDELYLKIREYQEKTDRPVYVYMGSMAASGGYYISAPADKILANRNCWTGSIGVTLGTQFDISEFLKKNGIKAENLTSGPNKAMGSYVEPMTNEQRKIFQSLIDDAYDQFVGIIADGRDMSIKEVKKIGDGRIYTAKQALSNGLIDGIMTEEEATAMLKEDNSLQSCKVVKIENYVDESWLDEFIYAKVKPLLESLASKGQGELGTAIELAEQDDDVPLKYMYER